MPLLLFAALALLAWIVCVVESAAERKRRLANYRRLRKS